MWRCRNFVNRNLRFTWRLLFSLRRASEKLRPGTRRAEEERFGSHGGLKAREGTGSEGRRRPRTTKAAPPERPPPLRGRVVQSWWRSLRRKGARRAEGGRHPAEGSPGGAAGLWSHRRPSRKGWPFERQGFDGPVGGGAVPDEPFQSVGRLRRRGQGRQRSRPAHRGRSGRAARRRLSLLVPGCGAGPQGLVLPLRGPDGASSRAPLARAEEARMWRPGGASSRGVRFVSRPDT